ncbi:hypothetical protein AOCH_001573 [Aspergillus ochraceoroseus]|uniref:25S rRNA (uridine-N(3))-methyltransferase BMT5-like domain-containing protein n=1 Tax=Aspergillus ochraceoroseus TaxID=138278 RepID=A0A0F8U6V5_9EURO|nr:hypothetical protein AOCH_001573 [Aspergillus ochraceoroseus]
MRPGHGQGQAQGGNLKAAAAAAAAAGEGVKKHRKMHTFSKLSTQTKNSSSSSSSNNSLGGSRGARARASTTAAAAAAKTTWDFSFARSLVQHHHCKQVTATCYDSQETLYGKYPQAERNISDILGAGSGHCRSKNHANANANDEEEEHAEHREEESNEAQAHKSKLIRKPHVLFSVDARKLGSPAGGGKDVRVGYPRRERKRPAWEEAAARKKGEWVKEVNAGGAWDMICFNFPHVGGLSTDVNRQVRANQELLVAFFKACVPLLASRPDVRDDDDDDEEEEEESDDGSATGSDEEDDDEVKAKREWRTEPGQILVTLFEGEPYTLWNIRDLARHAGLKVVTSFKFPWTCYHGYSHARTIGEIEGKDGGRGGWRGEDRDARTYVFEVKTEDHVPAPGTGKRKKRAADTDESDSD